MWDISVGDLYDVEINKNSQKAEIIGHHIYKCRFCPNVEKFLTGQGLKDEWVSQHAAAHRAAFEALFEESDKLLCPICDEEPAAANENLSEFGANDFDLVTHLHKDHSDILKDELAENFVEESAVLTTFYDIGTVISSQANSGSIITSSNLSCSCGWHMPKFSSAEEFYSSKEELKNHLFQHLDEISKKLNDIEESQRASSLLNFLKAQHSPETDANNESASGKPSQESSEYYTKNIVELFGVLTPLALRILHGVKNPFEEQYEHVNDEAVEYEENDEEVVDEEDSQCSDESVVEDVTDEDSALDDQKSIEVEDAEDVEQEDEEEEYVEEDADVDYEETRDVDYEEESASDDSGSDDEGKFEPKAGQKTESQTISDAMNALLNESAEDPVSDQEQEDDQKPECSKSRMETRREPKNFQKCFCHGSDCHGLDPVANRLIDVKAEQTDSKKAQTILRIKRWKQSDGLAEDRDCVAHQLMNPRPNRKRNVITRPSFEASFVEFGPRQLVDVSSTTMKRPYTKKIGCAREECRHTKINITDLMEVAKHVAAHIRHDEKRLTMRKVRTAKCHCGFEVHSPASFALHIILMHPFNFKKTTEANEAEQQLMGYFEVIMTTELTSVLGEDRAANCDIQIEELCAYMCVTATDGQNDDSEESSWPMKIQELCIAWRTLWSWRCDIWKYEVKDEDVQHDHYRDPNLVYFASPFLPSNSLKLLPIQWLRFDKLNDALLNKRPNKHIMKVWTLLQLWNLEGKFDDMKLSRIMKNIINCRRFALSKKGKEIEKERRKRKREKLQAMNLASEAKKYKLGEIDPQFLCHPVKKPPFDLLTEDNVYVFDNEKETSDEEIDEEGYEVSSSAVEPMTEVLPNEALNFYREFLGREADLEGGGEERRMTNIGEKLDDIIKGMSDVIGTNPEKIEEVEPIQDPNELLATLAAKGVEVKEEPPEEYIAIIHGNELLNPFGTSGFNQMATNSSSKMPDFSHVLMEAPRSSRPELGVNRGEQQKVEANPTPGIDKTVASVLNMPLSNIFMATAEHQAKLDQVNYRKLLKKRREMEAEGPEVRKKLSLPFKNVIKSKTVASVLSSVLGTTPQMSTKQTNRSKPVKKPTQPNEQLGCITARSFFDCESDE